MTIVTTSSLVGATQAAIPPQIVASDSRGGIQQGLLILTVACAVLTLLPGLRLAGSIALGGVSFLSSMTNIQDSWPRADQVTRIANCFRMCIAAVGIIALATASPV